MEFYISPEISRQLLATDFSFTSSNNGNSKWIKKLEKVKDSVLGKDYNLSLNFISKASIRELNLKWRDKDKATDVLSFPYGELDGEIFFSPAVIKQRHKMYDRSIQSFCEFLFVHSLYHLLGYHHGKKMDEKEAETREEFNL